MPAPARPEAPNARDVHPLTLAVVRHKLLAIAEEVVETMVRTCFSPLLNQSRDFSAVILDAECRIIAQAERLPIHMGAMPFAVRAMADAFAGEVEDGDVLMANDPYYGGSHLPDITLAKPVLYRGRIKFWVANRAHQGDIGGLSAGSYSPRAREIWHEGVRVPPVKFVRRGILAEDLLRMVCENTRKPDELRGDVMAQYASVTVGAGRLIGLFERYGEAEIGVCAESILAAGEAAMRAEARRWTPGSYDGVAYQDDDGCGNPELPIRVRVTVKEDAVEVDFSDSPDQVRSFMNSPIANTVAAVNCAFMYLCDDPQSQNDGVARVIKVITRKGSLLDPVMPAPATACTTLTASGIIEAIMVAMEKTAPVDVVCGFARRYRYIIAGTDRAGRSYIWHYFSNFGGSGANACEDGWPNLGIVFASGAMPTQGIERTESSFPLLIEEYGFRTDSAGAGTQRGGTGGIYAMRYEGDAPAVVNAAGDGARIAPHGLTGGRDGAPHRYFIRRDGGEIPISPLETDFRLEPGDVIVSLSAGGGGFGDPGKRNRDRLRHDVAYGHLSERMARELYGYEN